MRTAPLTSLSLWILLALLAGCPGGGTPGGEGPDAAVTIDAGPDVDAPTANATVVRVHYPAGAHTVSLRGSGAPLSWTAGVALTPGADDTWTFTALDLAGPVELKPLLDDTTWSRGANYHVAPGQTVDLYPHFTATRGQVVTLVQRFHSTALNDDRTIRAYLPASYGENSRARYPVVYMHDGQNLFDPATAFGNVEWQVDEALDDASEVGRCASGATCNNDGECGGAGACLSTRAAIVIGIDNAPDRIWELTPTRDAEIGDGGGADRYLTMVAEELKPVVDQMLRTAPGPGDTAIMGSSLGGLVSAYAGVTKPAVFGLVGAMSPSTWWDDRVIIGRVGATQGATPRPLRVYVDSGDGGPSMDGVTDTNRLVATYVDVGYVEGSTLRHVVQPGATHTERFWAERFPAAAFFLLGARP